MFGEQSVPDPLARSGTELQSQSGINQVNRLPGNGISPDDDPRTEEERERDRQAIELGLSVMAELDRRTKASGQGVPRAGLERHQNHPGIVDGMKYPGVTGWIGASPELRAKPSLVQDLLDDMLDLLRPYGVRSVYSGEPRTYRLGPKGRTLLTEAIAARRPDALIMSQGSRSPWNVDVDEVMASIFLTTPAHPHIGSRFEVYVSPRDPAAWSRVCTVVSEFVIRWFARLEGAAAFVSVQGRNDHWHILGDAPGLTRHEASPGRGMILTWPAMQRYLRGAFWGTGLGASHCERLGGRDQVLATAPAPIARSVGNGVWLQLSETPPAPPDALTALSEFLKPLLDFTQADILRDRTDAEAAIAGTGQTATATSGPPRPDEATRAAAREKLLIARREKGLEREGSRVAVRVRGLRQLEIDSALNIKLADAPTLLQQAIVEEVVEGWYEEGTDHGFGDGHLHYLNGPSLDGAVLRWSIDFGSSDALAAVRALAQRLANLPEVSVTQLALGAEELG
jgi:hypothetical protein